MFLNLRRDVVRATAHPSVWGVCGLLLSICTAGMAQSMESDRPKLPLWEVGGVALGSHQLAYPGSDQHVNRAIVLPTFQYRGKLFRADRETVGVRLAKTSDYEFDVSVGAAFGAKSSDVEARRGMRELGTLVELGPRLKVHLGQVAGGRVRLDLPVRGVFDLNDSLAYRGLTMEPRVVFERATQGWFYATSVGAVLGNRRLNDTFYGVTQTEATATRSAYTATGGLTAWRLGASLGRRLTPDWSVFGFGRLDTVAGAANVDSPLVRQKSGATVGMAVTYTFMRSDESAVD